MNRKRYERLLQRQRQAQARVDRAQGERDGLLRQLGESEEQAEARLAELLEQIRVEEEKLAKAKKRFERKWGQRLD